MLVEKAESAKIQYGKMHIESLMLHLSFPSMSPFSTFHRKVSIDWASLSRFGTVKSALF